MKFTPHNVILTVFLTATAVMPVCAQQTLTLSLETPSLEQRAQCNSQRESIEAQARHLEETQERNVKVENGKRVPIGRVAVVDDSKSRIYSRRSSSGRVYSICDKGVPLAIVGEVGEWYGVLMIDGSTGWIKKQSVKLLDYQVVASHQPTRSEFASRGMPESVRGSAAGGSIVQSAFQYRGVPYVWGGNTESGIDCSGFLKKVFAQNGISLPRTAREQANVGTPIGYSELSPGDRLYFCYKKSYIDHCGIYIGDGMFIHSSVSNRGVAVDKLEGRHAQALVCAMR